MGNHTDSLISNIQVGNADGFTIYRNAFHPDAWPLVQAFRAAPTAHPVLSNWHPDRKIHAVTAEGKTYVVKWLKEKPARLEKQFQEYIHGPFYPRLMRRMIAAQHHGCDRIQTIYLVAERITDGKRETFVVLEYVEGRPLSDRAECTERGEEVAQAMKSLHQYRLALGDVNYKNFILHDNTIRIIDLSARGFFRLDRMKDIVRMKMRYRIVLPLSGVLEQMLYCLILVQQHIFYRMRLLRNKKTNPFRPPKKPDAENYSDAGYNIVVKNDGIDYWALYKRFAANEIPSTRLENHSRWRDIFMVEQAGKKYVIKHDRSGWGFGGEGKFERAFWRVVRGPFYSRLFRRALAAEQNGCDTFQKIYMVAEKRILHYCTEAILIMEYLEGPTLRAVPDISPLLPGIAECLTAMHANGLAQCDVAAHNFILTADGIKAVDLSCRGNQRIDMIKDAIRAKRVWGLELSVPGIFNRFLHRILNFYYAARHDHFGYRTKKYPLSRHKYFKK